MNSLRGILAGLLLLSWAGLAAAQMPDVIEIVAPDGGSTLYSSDATGTLTGTDFVCSWTIQDGSAVFDYAGYYTSNIYDSPWFRIDWTAVTDPMPLHVDLTSTGSGTWSAASGYSDSQTGEQTAFYEPERTGDWELGLEYPACDLVLIEFVLDDPSVVYDVRIAIEWGPDVPAGEFAWDSVKALYR